MSDVGFREPEDFERSIFVFGSNRQGIHGAGAALFAKKHHGAKQGVGEGLTGDAYALPTKDTPYKTLSLVEMQVHIDRLGAVVAAHRDTLFRITRVGTGLAGHPEDKVAPYFQRFGSNAWMIDDDGAPLCEARNWLHHCQLKSTGACDFLVLVVAQGDLAPLQASVRRLTARKRAAGHRILTHSSSADSAYQAVRQVRPQAVVIYEPWPEGPAFLDKMGIAWRQASLP